MGNVLLFHGVNSGFCRNRTEVDISSRKKYLDNRGVKLFCGFSSNHAESKWLNPTHCQVKSTSAVLRKLNSTDRSFCLLLTRHSASVFVVCFYICKRKALSLIHIEKFNATNCVRYCYRNVIFIFQSQVGAIPLFRC